MVRDFAAELVAARAAGDWAAHELIWEERRVAGVEADEDALEDEYAPGDKVMYRGELAEIDSRYEISGDYIVLCADGLYRSASCLALSRPAGLPDQTAERSALVGGVQVPGTAPMAATTQEACPVQIAERIPMGALRVSHNSTTDSVVLVDALTEDDVAEVFHCERHTVSQTPADAEKWARLFVAAPKMLAALLAVLAVRPSNHDDMDDPEAAAAWQGVSSAIHAVSQVSA
ncbi:hypothetical protein [Sphingomonas sp. Ant20]|uniref:hypothetical protein n=1 Tax=Sphingomonas sp. Ant20 TaxID=104605 RepID=UPI0005370C9E|nr:hypothetical protein [Sphingomonas sp. Ant20]KHA63415.1 hypothetical protein NI18_16000 [Sphingomonas sp. Ant20]